MWVVLSRAPYSKAKGEENTRLFSNQGLSWWYISIGASVDGNLFPQTQFFFPVTLFTFTRPLSLVHVQIQFL
jgi:hypothetical protein